MKYFIVGKQCVGKQACLNKLEEMDIAVGHEFSNIPEPYPQVYIDPKYERYSTDDINKIFENNAYVCIGGIEEQNVLDSYMFYRGISMYTYDNSDVMILTPNQVTSINKKVIREEPITFIWMDNTEDKRQYRYLQEHRKYSFKEIESLEKHSDMDFMKAIYEFPNSNVLYFVNEEPERVATIIASCVKHPDLLPLFVENYK